VVKNDRYYAAAVDKISGLFWVSCALNAIWIVSFSYIQIGLSAIFIFAFAITLALILLRLREIQDRQHFLLPLTFGIYTGWLLIATVVNISAWLVRIKWAGFGLSNEAWGGIILIVAILVVLGVLSKTANAALPLPLAWAYFGIYRFLVAPEGLKGQFGTLQTVCLAGVAVYGIMALVQFYRNGMMVVPASRS
jgi:translocator protein